MAVFYIGTELYSAGTPSEDRRLARCLFNRPLTSTVTDGVKTVLLARNNKYKDTSAGHDTGNFVCDWLSGIDMSVSRINKSKVDCQPAGPNSNTALGFILTQLPLTFTSWWKDPGLAGFYPHTFY